MKEVKAPGARERGIEWGVSLLLRSKPYRLAHSRSAHPSKDQATPPFLARWPSSSPIRRRVRRLA